MVKRRKRIRVKAHRRHGRWVKSHSKMVLVGKSKKSADRKRHAMHPGKRISKRGKVYFEHRRNRADIGEYL